MTGDDRLAGTGTSNLTTLSESVAARGSTFPLHGAYEPAYRPVVDAFLENFRLEDETGSACSVVKNGRTVVDIWGGFANRDRTTPWEKHSTVCMMSVAKGVTSIAFNMLVDRGLIDVDAPRREVLAESSRRTARPASRCAGCSIRTAAIPVLTTDPLWPGAMYDRESYVEALAKLGAALGARHEGRLSRAQHGISARRSDEAGVRQIRQRRRS